MYPIKIFDINDLSFVGIIDNYKSLQFTKKWNGYSKFKLVINRYSNYASDLKIGTLVHLSDSKCGIIKHRVLKLDSKGKESEEWEFSGYTLDYIVRQRIAIPPQGSSHEDFSGYAEDAMHYYVDRHIINPTDSLRKIPHVIASESLSRGGHITASLRFQRLDEQFEKWTRLHGVMWDVVLDPLNKKLKFITFEGVDRTTLQQERPPVIFSSDFENLEEQDYIESELSYVSDVTVGGKGDGIERLIEHTGGRSGIERVEQFLDASDLTTSSGLKNRGVEFLSEHLRVETFEGKIIETNTFLYERDWNVGDFVTVKSKTSGVTLHTIVSEVKEIHSAGNPRKLVVTFGEEIPNFATAIKRDLSNVSEASKN